MQTVAKHPQSAKGELVRVGDIPFSSNLNHYYDQVSVGVEWLAKETASSRQSLELIFVVDTLSCV